MHFFVTLTTDCNLKCSYCYGKCCNDIGNNYSNFGIIDYSIPNNISYKTELIEGLARRITIDSIIFYGGEPLLRTEKIMEIMDLLPKHKFLLQTNGLFLKKLETTYLKKIHTILVSIDGNKKVTDAYRGRGVYNRIISNIYDIKKRGFKGELIARMTVGKETMIDKQVTHLLFNQDCFFDSVHWQLDVQFGVNDFESETFSNWIQVNYVPRLKKLLKLWIRYMQENGKVLRIYPFIGIVQTLLNKEESLLRCGSGWNQFNIQTDGNLVPCPVMSGLKDYYLGNIKNIEIEDLQRIRFKVGKPCSECKLFNICGGRCLYANITKLWGEEGFQLVCTTVSELVAGIERELPKIRALIEEKKIAIVDFNYTKFNSCEIIP